MAKKYDSSRLALIFVFLRKLFSSVTTSHQKSVEWNRFSKLVWGTCCQTHSLIFVSSVQALTCPVISLPYPVPSVSL